MSILTYLNFLSSLNASSIVVCSSILVCVVLLLSFFREAIIWKSFSPGINDFHSGTTEIFPTFPASTAFFKFFRILFGFGDIGSFIWKRVVIKVMLSSFRHSICVMLKAIYLGSEDITVLKAFSKSPLWSKPLSAAESLQANFTLKSTSKIDPEYRFGSTENPPRSPSLMSFASWVFMEGSAPLEAVTLRTAMTLPGFNSTTSTLAFPTFLRTCETAAVRFFAKAANLELFLLRRSSDHVTLVS